MDVESLIAIVVELAKRIKGLVDKCKEQRPQLAAFIKYGYLLPLFLFARVYLAAWTKQVLACILQKIIACYPVLPFQPKYRLGHPENYLFLLSENIFIGSEHPKIS